MSRKQCADCNKEQYKDCQHEYKESTTVSGYCRKCNMLMTPPEWVTNNNNTNIVQIPQVIEVLGFINNLSVEVKFNDTIFNLGKGDKITCYIPYVTKIEDIQSYNKEHQHITGQMNWRNELIKHKYCPECGELNNNIK